METVNMHEAKTNLSRLVSRAAAGESFIIARAGKPLVQVTAISPATSPARRKLGFLKGQYNVPDDLKAFAREEIDEMFFGHPEKLTTGKRKR